MLAKEENCLNPLAIPLKLNALIFSLINNKLPRSRLVFLGIF
ncbi:hypothetical protein [Spiroplasma endosymbiont of Dilophus febrilis]